jgi:PTS system galactitol-specific IIA component
VTDVPSAESEVGAPDDEPRVVAALSLVRPPLSSATEVLRAVAALALQHGFVRPTFGDALVAREATHPTGLPTPVPVAIPHTDVEHVVRPALAAVLLDPPVPFGEMGGSGAQVDVRLAVVLMVTDPSSQVGLLSRLITALRQPTLGDALAGVREPEALAHAVEALVAEAGD